MLSRLWKTFRRYNQALGMLRMQQEGMQNSIVCAGKRWNVSRLIRNGKPYTFPICQGEDKADKQSKQHPSIEGLEPSRCRAKKCDKKIRASDDFLACSKCESEWHKTTRYSEMTRKQVENLGDRASWICLTCESIEDRASQQNTLKVDATNFRHGNRSQPSWTFSNSISQLGPS